MVVYNYLFEYLRLKENWKIGNSFTVLSKTYILCIKLLNSLTEKCLFIKPMPIIGF